jgi:hypothetical protein
MVALNYQEVRTNGDPLEYLKRVVDETPVGVYRELPIRRRVGNEGFIREIYAGFTRGIGAGYSSQRRWYERQEIKGLPYGGEGGGGGSGGVFGNVAPQSILSS